MYLIPIGSNIGVAPPAGFDRAAWRANLGVAPDGPVLCYFGFVSPAKGGETLVRALGLLNGAGKDACHLLMVGGAVGDSDPTSQAYLDQVWTLIRQLGLADRVHWTGFAAPEQVSAHLLAADIAVLPYREGANLRHGSLHAALAHGLPVVTTSRPMADRPWPAVVTPSSCRPATPRRWRRPWPPWPPTRRGGRGWPPAPPPWPGSSPGRASLPPTWRSIAV